jgi:hypothetical protein
MAGAQGSSIVKQQASAAKWHRHRQHGGKISVKSAASAIIRRSVMARKKAAWRNGNGGKICNGEKRSSQRQWHAANKLRNNGEKTVPAAKSSKRQRRKKMK